MEQSLIGDILASRQLATALRTGAQLISGCNRDTSQANRRLGGALRGFATNVITLASAYDGATLSERVETLISGMLLHLPAQGVPIAIDAVELEDTLRVIAAQAGIATRSLAGAPTALRLIIADRPKVTTFGTTRQRTAPRTMRFAPQSTPRMRTRL